MLALEAAMGSKGSPLLPIYALSMQEADGLWQTGNGKRILADFGEIPATTAGSLW
jgi:hypothetical protein